MTRIALSQSDSILTVEHGGRTLGIDSVGTYTVGSFDAVLGYGDTVIFDNTPEPEPLPRPEVGEHIWTILASGEVRTGTVTGFVTVPAGEYLSLKDATVGSQTKITTGIWWPGTLKGDYGYDFRLVAWGPIDPEPEPAPRKLVWPKGTHIGFNGNREIGATRTVVKDAYEGEPITYKLTYSDGADGGLHATRPEDVKRVYVVGDTLPAGEPMPANGLLEWPAGHRYYVKIGQTFRYDTKIIWLEGEA